MRKALCAAIGIVIFLFSLLNADTFLKHHQILPISKESKTLIKDLNAVGLSHFYLMKKGPNALVSPFATQSSLLMAYMGSKGQTAEDFVQSLNITLGQKEIGPAYSALYTYLYSPEKSDSMYRFKISNSMWVNDQTKILSPFKDIVKEDFHGKIETVNFTDLVNAIKTINDWLSEEVGGKISPFIMSKEITPSTRMILTNSIVLNGQWESPFPTEETGSQPFLSSQNVSIDVPTMHQITDLPYFEDEDSQILALPIQKEVQQAQLALIIFLPKKPKLSGIFDFYYAKQQISSGSFLDFIDDFKKKRIDLHLPKFAVNHRIFLKDFYLSIGMRKPFVASADFSGIDGKTDLYISNVFNQSSISINEGGLFAFSASGATFNIKSTLNPLIPVSFRANHPFFYCIADLRSKLILYLGIFDDPSMSVKEVKTK